MNIILSSKAIIVFVISILSIVACTEEEIFLFPSSQIKNRLETYIYKGVAYLEPSDGISKGKFSHNILNKAWFENDNAAILFKNNVYYIYDNDKALMKNRHGKNHDDKIAKGTQPDFPFASIDLYHDQDHQVRISGYAGSSSHQKFDFGEMKSINDEISSIKVSNGSHDGDLIIRFCEHSHLDNRYPGKTITMEIKPGKFIQHVWRQRFNDMISSWEFYYR